jgi:hypothetical protein
MQNKEPKMTDQPPAKNNLDKIIDKIITSFSEIYNTLGNEK